MVKLCLTFCCFSLFAVPLTAECQAFLSFITFQCLLKFLSIEQVMLYNHPILCQPFPLLPLIFPSIRVFYNEFTLLIRWPKYWSFSFSISPSNEDSGLISFRIDSFDLLAVKGALKNLLQHHSLEAWILQCSAFFMVQPHVGTWMTTGSTIYININLLKIW